MTNDTARLLLVNLLERMDADLAAFRGLVSSGEREALRLLTEVAPSTPLEGGTAAPTSETHVERQHRSLDRRAIAPQQVDDSIVFCLDFGTAKSKAFAVSPDYSPACLRSGWMSVLDSCDRVRSAGAWGGAA